MKKTRQVQWRRVLMAVILLILILATFVVQMHSRYQHQQSVLVNTHQNKMKLEAFIHSLTSSETGQRGYLLTQDHSYLDTYSYGRIKAYEYLMDLKVSLAGLENAIEPLESIFLDKIDEMQQTIILSRQVSYAAAIDLVREHRGLQLMERISAQVVSIQQQLSSQEQQARAELAQSYQWFLSSIGFTFLMMLLFAVFYIRSERQKLKAFEGEQAQRRFFQSLLHSATDGLHIMDTTGRLVACSQSFADALGYSMAQMQEKYIWDWDINVSKETVLNFIETMGSQPQPLRVMCQHKTSKGVLFDVENHLQKIMIDGKEYIFASAHDLTEQTRRVAALQQANTKIEEMSQAKSQFIANISHELRTPINGVLGLIEHVLRNGVSEDQEHSLKQAKRSSKALLRVINDILDFSRMDEGNFIIEQSEFSIDDLAQYVVDVYGYEAQKQNLMLEVFVDYRIPKVLLGDRLRLTQVVNNFVSNALKFTQQGRITFEVNLMHFDSQAVVVDFLIKDTGCGIDSSEQLHLFQPFEQVDAGDNKAQAGSGLGLVISQRLIDLMGGELIFESTRHQGSIFGMKIKFAYDAGKQPEVPKLAMFSPILLVSGNSRERIYLTGLFNSWSVHCDVVETLEEAVQSMEVQHYHRLIVDTDALDMLLLKQIDSLASQTPITLLTNSAQKTTYLKQLADKEILVHSVLEKPFLSQRIFHGFNQALRHHNQERTERQITLAESKKVLLVDDVEINLFVAREMMQSIGFKVDCAENGQQAVFMADSFEYDMIFMDIQMPILDGVQAAKQIRDFNSSVPIIALTASLLSDEKQTLIDEYMDGAIAKPLARKSLLKLIKHYFELKV